MSRRTYSPQGRQPQRRARATAAPTLAAVVLALLATLGGLVGPAPAWAQEGDAATAPAGPSDDPFMQQAHNAQRRQQLEAELGALQATNEDLQAVLADLQRQIDARTAEVEAAQQALADATAAAQRAAKAEADKAREVADLEERMRQMAVELYVNPPSDQKLSVILQGGTVNDLSTAMVYFDAKFGHDVDLARQLERARVQLEARKRDAQDAVSRASARSDEVAAALTELQAVQQGQQELAAVLEQRMAEITEERTTLEAGDPALAEEITKRRAELASLAKNSSRSDVPLVRIQGIQVHASLAGPLAAMLAAAKADGIELGGGGYRSFDAQVATRRANCGSDDYSVWHKPASQCSPPTARPGTSMHELGLAIDLTHNGSIISSRNSPAFQWLAEHAAEYGFKNLPSEPWHWSTTGG